MASNQLSDVAQAELAAPRRRRGLFRFDAATFVGLVAAFGFVALGIAFGGPTKPFIDLLACDASGFILAGADIPVEHGRPRGWPLARARYMFETNVAGVIAAGDIRSGANRRRSSAAAEGHRARAARVQSFGRLLQRVLCRVGLRWRQQP